jgi:hypothetical protein
MSTTDIKADMQDVLYRAMHESDPATSEEALGALMPIVDRYVAAELMRLADHHEPSVDHELSDGEADFLNGIAVVVRYLRVRSAELGGAK